MAEVALLLVMFFLGAESGASFPWSSRWQNWGRISLRQLPEILTAIIISCASVYCYGILGLDIYGSSWGLTAFILSWLVSYAGIQSATWSFLKWETGPNRYPDRDFTQKPIVDWLASKIGGWEIGEEGYSWISAFVKGTVITLPLGGFGGILFALGYEIGSHAKGRLKNPHMYSEGLSFLLGIGVYINISVAACELIGAL